MFVQINETTSEELIKNKTITEYDVDMCYNDIHCTRYALCTYLYTVRELIKIHYRQKQPLQPRRCTQWRFNRRRTMRFTNKGISNNICVRVCTTVGYYYSVSAKADIASSHRFSPQSYCQ